MCFNTSTQRRRVLLVHTSSGSCTHTLTLSLLLTSIILWRVSELIQAGMDTEISPWWQHHVHAGYGPAQPPYLQARVCEELHSIKIKLRSTSSRFPASGELELFQQVHPCAQRRPGGWKHSSVTSSNFHYSQWKNKLFHEVEIWYLWYATVFLLVLLAASPIYCKWNTDWRYIPHTTPHQNTQTITSGFSWRR